MTDQSAAEMVTEIRRWMADHDHFHSARRRDVTRLLAALEAAEQRAEKVASSLRAQTEVFIENAREMGRYRDERDALAAVVEKVREEAEAYAKQPDVMEPCGAVAQTLQWALASAPANALRDVKAEVWDGAVNDTFRHCVEHPHWTPSDIRGRNPYREEQL